MQGEKALNYTKDFSCLGGVVTVTDITPGSRKKMSEIGHTRNEDTSGAPTIVLPCSS